MAEFLALLCWWVAVGCGETATHIWDLPKGETVVISQEVQNATGTLMERPAPILSVNFCKRSEYAPNCWEWNPNGQEQIVETIELEGSGPWEWRIHGSGHDGHRCVGWVGGKRFDFTTDSVEMYDDMAPNGWHRLRADYMSGNEVRIQTDTYRCAAIVLEFRGTA